MIRCGFRDRRARSYRQTSNQLPMSDREFDAFLVSDQPCFTFRMCLLRGAWESGWGGPRHPHARQAFDGERNALVRMIGIFNPSNLISRISESLASREAVAAFAESVTLHKVKAGCARDSRKGIGLNSR